MTEGGEAIREAESNPRRGRDLFDGDGVRQQNPRILAFYKELESVGLETERATEYLRRTTTVCEERCSSLDMVLRKKNIKPIKMTNIAPIFLSFSRNACNRTFMSIHTACPLQLPLAASWEEIYILCL